MNVCLTVHCYALCHYRLGRVSLKSRVSGQIYSMDMDLELCTCPVGHTGAVQPSVYSGEDLWLLIKKNAPQNTSDARRWIDFMFKL